MPDQRIVLTYDPDGTLVDRVRAALPHRSLEIVCEYSSDALPEVMPGTTILFGNYLAAEALEQSRDLRWIQTVGAGVDVLLSVDLTSTDIVVTNTSGAFGVQIAEHALSLMFALARRLPAALESQAARRYAPEPRDDLFELTGKTVGIVGFGDVGQALARRARGIGMRVIALRRSPGDSPATSAELADLALDPLADSDRGDASALVYEVMGPDRLSELLRESDVVVNAAPLTDATVRLFGREQFGHMRSTACFINLGRGETVDQEALIDALQDGVIAGAGLDVTTPEPLPPDSPLWALPNVILTAHYAGWSDTMLDRIYAIFADNLQRFDRGEPLRNRVDVRAGY
ncbi:MAG: D-2-hydroxyacid dehydrogenase [Chloroflexi bacterium]|nr:D-2-hydroxyacid dehydrogenase [Chloroflexota bacterium]